MSIADKLQNLSVEELASVCRLIEKFTTRQGGDKKKKKGVDKQPKKRYDEPVQAEELEEDNPEFAEVPDEEPVQPRHGPGRNKSNKRIILEDETPEVSRNAGRQGRRQGRSESINQQTRSPRRGEGSSRGQGVQARTEPVQLSGKNKFEQMDARLTSRGDTKIDRKLWGDNSPTERPPEYQPVEVQCKVCNRYFDINPNLVYVDFDTKVPNFTCDSCSPRGKQ